MIFQSDSLGEMISTQAYEHELDQRNVLTLCFLMVTVLLQVFPPNSLEGVVGKNIKKGGFEPRISLVSTELMFTVIVGLEHL